MLSAIHQSLWKLVDLCSDPSPGTVFLVGMLVVGGFSAFIFLIKYYDEHSF